MTSLTDRIAEARDIAVEREGDIRLKEFLRAVIIYGDSNAPMAVCIRCHTRSWWLFFASDPLLQREAMGMDELAGEVASWIQGAFESDFLSISEPPIVYREYSRA